MTLVLLCLLLRLAVGQVYQLYPLSQVFFQTLENTQQVDPKGSSLPFMGWLPSGYYNVSEDEKLPLVITLLGRNECGGGGRWELEKMSNWGALKHVRGLQTALFEEAKTILISPQVNCDWVYYDYDSSVILNEFIDYVVKEFNVDENRIYLTGMSMGGGGSWYYGRDFAHRLAALTVGSPNGDPRLNEMADYNNLANSTTIWIHHAADDKSGDPCWWSSGRPYRSYVSGDEGWANGIAIAMGGPPATRMLDTYPQEVTVTTAGITLTNGDELPLDRTATFSLEQGWTWADGTDFIEGHRLQMTMYHYGGHLQGFNAMWGDGGPNEVFWRWMFAQRKGLLPSSSTNPVVPPSMSPTTSLSPTTATPTTPTQPTSPAPTVEPTTSAPTLAPTPLEPLEMAYAVLDGGPQPALGSVPTATTKHFAEKMCCDTFHMVLTIVSCLIVALASCLYYKKLIINAWRPKEQIPKAEKAEKAEKADKDDQQGEYKSPEIPPAQKAPLPPPPPLPQPPPPPAYQKTDDPVPSYTKLETPAAQPRPAGGKVTATRLDSFGAARFLASVHIVAGHLFRKDPRPVPDWWTSEFGYTWVPWFMMMSGFILCYARLASRTPNKLQPTAAFMKARLLSIYPLYLTGLLCSFAIQVYEQGSAAIKPVELLLSVTLLQAWIPTYTESVLQAHCWFLSCIIPYWLVHQWMYVRLKEMSAFTLKIILATCWLVPSFLVVLGPTLAGVGLHWYDDHTWGSTATAQDTIFIMLKYHPLCYFHIYVFGMATACLYVNEYATGDKSRFLTYGTSIGYFSLFFIFFISHWANLPSPELTCRLGFLAPLQGLSMVGLAIGMDPMARLFGALFFPALENLSYPQYIFQFLAYTVWAAFATFGYWAFLMALSVIGYRFIQWPFRLTRGKPAPIKTRLIGAFSMMGLPFLMLLLYTLSPHNAGLVDAPGKVVYGADAYDVRLNLTQTSGQPLAGRFQEGEYFYINPSLLHLKAGKNRYRQVEGVGEWGGVCTCADGNQYWVGDNGDECGSLACEGGTSGGCSGLMPLQWAGYKVTCASVVKDTLVLAVRRHRVENTVERGLSIPHSYVDDEGKVQNVTATAREMMTWYSDVSITVLDPVTLEPLRPVESLIMTPSEKVDEWTQCLPEATYTAHNNSLTQLRLVGAQDPRMFRSPLGDPSNLATSEIGLTFFSMPVAESDSTVCQTPGRVFRSDLPANLLGSLQSTSATAVSAEKKEFTVRASQYPDYSVWIAEATQKNWMAFWIGQDLFYIARLNPYTIVGVDPSGETYTRYEGFIPKLELTYENNKKVVFHGGANAILIQPQESTTNQTLPSYLTRAPYFLAAFHMIDENGEYLNYLFEFAVEYPNLMVRISRPLPLVLSPVRDRSIGRPIAFLSGLTLLKSGEVALSYGSSNAESRVLVISRAMLENLFV